MKRRNPIPIRDEPIELDIVHDNNELHTIAPETDEAGVGAVVIHHIVTVIIVCLILMISVWAYLTFKSSSFFSKTDQEQPRITQWAVDAQVDRIEFALKVFRRLNAKYPADLDELVSAGLLVPSDPTYPPSTGTAYKYRRVGDTYELSVQTETTETKTTVR